MKPTQTPAQQPTDDLVDRIPAGIYQADEQGFVSYCNPRAALILGYNHPRELIGKKLKSLYVDPSDRDKLLGIMEVAKEKGSENFRIRMKKPSGDVVVISVNSQYRDSGGAVEGTFTDVTELANYESLFEDLPAGVYQLDDELNIIKCNPGFEKVFGYEPGTLTGEPASKLYLDVNDMYRLNDELKGRLGSGQQEIRSRVIEMKKENGDSVWISLTTHLRLDGNGQVVGREGTVIETTLEEAKKRKQICGHCYVAVPYRQEFHAIHDKILKPLAAQHKYMAQKADSKMVFTESMRTKMYGMIRNADFVIGDMTGDNPNVMYELGLAHAFGKPVIMISQDNEIPVNVREYEFIHYQDTLAGLDLFKKNLSRAILHVHEELMAQEAKRE
ncbi:MAG: PAS domain S-box protein [bacterium]|nr:PAS domain S-box protein [bacterium]